MPKVRWRDRLQGKPYKPKDICNDSKKKQQQRKWRMACDRRKRAQQAMDDLTLLLEQLPKVSKHPGRDYAMIFQDENRYFKLLEAMGKAYDLSIEFNIRRFNPEHLPIFQDAFSRAGMGYYSKTQLKKRWLREKLLDQLKQKETKDGNPYYKDAYSQTLTKKPAQVARIEAEAAFERVKKTIAIWRSRSMRDNWSPS